MKNPDLPSYENAAYQRQKGNWAYVDDVFVGPAAWFPRNAQGEITLSNRSFNYLTPFYSEKTKGGDRYLNRAKLSPFTARFKQAVIDFAGLLFATDVVLEGVPERISSDFNNIDGRGTPLSPFLSRLAIATLRRGHTFCLVDGASGGVRWREYGSPQLLNWGWDNGTLVRATLRRTEMVSVGVYGESSQTRYLNLTPGRWQVLELAKGAGSDSIPKITSAGIFGRTDGAVTKSLSMIPLVCFHSGEYPLECDEPFESIPPLQSLAELNIAHYQLHSDHLHKVRKCCFPVFVRTGDDDSGVLVLGPDAVVDVPIGGSFGVVEPESMSIQQSRLELEALTKAMDFLSLQFLVSPSDRQAAQVSVVQVAKMESGLSLFSDAFSTGITQALQVHGAYYGIPPEECGTARLEANLFKQRGDNPQLLEAYGRVFTELQALLSSNPELASKLESTLLRRGFLESSL